MFDTRQGSRVRNAVTLSCLLVFLAACGDSETGAGPERPGIGGRDVGGSGNPRGDADSDESTVDTTPEADAGTAEACEAGRSECVSLDMTRTCNSAGDAWTETACAANSYCLGDSGVCTPGSCRPGLVRCAGRIEREVCAETALSWEATGACDADEYCTDGVCQAQACLPNVMFAIDGSSSMSSQWPAVRASIAAVTSANPDVAFGLSMFPVGLGCSIGDGQRPLFGSAVNWPHVPISIEGSTAIDAWFGANDASGGATPLVSTIEWFSENVDAVWGPLPGNGHLVVMTEGADTCTCEDDDTRCMVDNLSAATRALAATGVHVYVIGYQYRDAPEALNAIASNGGSSITEFLVAGSEDTLITAFGEVITNAKLCE